MEFGIKEKELNGLMIILTQSLLHQNGKTMSLKVKMSLKRILISKKELKNDL